MTNLIKDKNHTLYERVSMFIRKQIEQGALKPGDKLPSLRQSSKQFNVSIATVTQGYSMLEERGLIESRPQSGYYVRARRRVSKRPQELNLLEEPRKVESGNTVHTVFSLNNVPGIIPLGLADPDVSLLPVKALNKAIRQVITNPASQRQSVDYSFPPGNAELRRQIAFRTTDIRADISPDDIVITNGATEALTISLRAVANPGDVIAIESPTYFSVLQIIERLGMLALEINTDPEMGMDISHLERQIQRVNIKAIVTVGNFSNPTGALMEDERKEELVNLITKHDIPLIEDDVFGDLFYSMPRPMTCKAYDTKGLVLSCSSFSKTIAPGYRVGWVMPGRYYDAVMQNKQLNSSASPSLTQMAIAEFLRSGVYERHLVRLRKAYRSQTRTLRKKALESFPEGTVITLPKGGFTLWVQLPNNINTNTLYRRALKNGISITPGSLFSPFDKHLNCMRICAGRAWSDEIGEAVETLAKITYTML